MINWHSERHTSGRFIWWKFVQCIPFGSLCKQEVFYNNVGQDRRQIVYCANETVMILTFWDTDEIWSQSRNIRWECQRQMKCLPRTKCHVLTIFGPGTGQGEFEADGIRRNMRQIRLNTTNIINNKILALWKPVTDVNFSFPVWPSNNWDFELKDRQDQN